MLIESLRSATAEQHKQLEGRLNPYLTSISTHSDYAYLLQAFHRFMFPVQELVSKYVDRNILPDYSERRQAGLIEADLADLGYQAVQMNTLPLPHITNNATAFGALYVMEGSTLGGKIISRMIKEQLGEHIPLRFFSGYKDQTGQKWKLFLQALEHPSNLLMQADVISAANETFSLFGASLEDSAITRYQKQA